MSLKQKLLVFPTSRSIREYISSINENIILPTMVTIDEFFSKSLKVEGLKFIDEEQRFLYLKEAIKIKDFDRLGLSSEFSQFLKQSDYIFRFFGELSHEMADIQKLKEADTYEYYEEHLNILNHIYKNYVQLLEQNSCVDKITLGKYYEINDSYLKQFDCIELFFEGYFTKFEFKIISQISKENNLFINLFTNEYNKKSWEEIEKLGITLELNKKYFLDITNKKIIEENEITKQNPSIDIVGFNTRVNQIAFVKKSVTNMISQGLEAKKIALVLPDESFKELLELFDYENYFNYAMGKDIYNSKLYKTLNAIFLYLNEDEPKHIELLKFLRIDENFVKKTFKNVWNEQFSQDVFEQIVNFAKEAETKDEIIEKFEDEIYRLKRLFFASNEKILTKDAYKILLQRISSISLDDVNSGAITVMGLLETRGVNFDGVILVDFNEGIVPKRSVKDKFLSTIVKQHANLPTIFDRENLQRYYYERLIFNAKNVSIAYVHNDTSQISRFAHELFSDYEFETSTQDKKYEQILYKKHKLHHFSKEIITECDLSKVVWSATSLKNFLQCKRKFYFNNILKIKEHHFSLKPQGFELGSIIHKILEDFYKDEISFPNEAQKRLDELFSNQRDKNPFLTLELEVYRRKLKEFLELEEQRFEKGNTIYALEKPFEIEYKGIKLKGVIDRIDKTKDGFEILDYKTSSNLKVDTLKTYEKSVDFQLEFYFLALKDMLKDEEKSLKLEPYYYDLNNNILLKEIVVEQKLELFDEIIKDFNTQEVNFSKCDDKSICQFCSYATICNR